MKNEYNRLRKNLIRSVKGYEKRGFDVSFFKIPEKPKKITQGSINRLKKAINEWKYYTDQPGVNVSQLGSNVYKTGKNKARNIGGQARDIRIKKAQEKGYKKIHKKEEELKDVPGVERPGVDYFGFPREEDNLAIKIYEIAEEAVEGSKPVSARQKAYLEVVKLKGRISIARFDDMGVLDPAYNEIYSFNLAQQDFVELANKFEAWLWASDQYANVDLSGLTMIIDYMTRTSKNLSFVMKQKLADMAAEEDIEVV